MNAQFKDLRFFRNEYLSRLVGSKIRQATHNFNNGYSVSILASHVKVVGICADRDNYEAHTLHDNGTHQYLTEQQVNLLMRRLSKLPRKESVRESVRLSARQIDKLNLDISQISQTFYQFTKPKE